MHLSPAEISPPEPLIAPPRPSGTSPPKRSLRAIVISGVALFLVVAVLVAIFYRARSSHGNLASGSSSAISPPAIPTIDVERGEF